MNKALHRIHSQHAKALKHAILKQRPLVIWMTGLPASGKSTLARALETRLLEEGYFTQWMDGDSLRLGLTSDLSFSDADQEENIRRSSEVAKLFLESGIITICTFISPTSHIRSIARNIIGVTNFMEVYLNCSLETCVQRDEENLYGRALRGGVVNLSGVSFPYEAPDRPSLELFTGYHSIEDCTNQLMEAIIPRIRPL
ncbi:adenylyl-sulfate kinase [Adhaeribacter aquaticus]|uniref:adenylyl-sulfate kinase n=1 Tax=Adhaeribacter aquaticus TaxID=299567 RepID=UPI000687B972|nr:adenylyl-sulfate kinase [Adhaeribacter aquaticus]